MKFIVAVVLAVVAVQLVQGTPASEPRNAKDKIEKAVKTVKKALETARDETYDGIQKGIDAVEVAFNKAEKEVGAALTVAIKEIQKLEEEAKEEGVETVECTEAQRQKVYNLRDETVAKLDEVGKNTTDVLERVQADVDIVLQDLVDVADGILKKFEDCKSILCQTKVLAESIKDLAIITAKVPGIVAKAVGDAVVTSANGVKAVEKLTVEYVLTTKEILDEVRQCIKDKVEA